jgi:magnesium-transporting ATPase (P-type)
MTIYLPEHTTHSYTHISLLQGLSESEAKVRRASGQGNVAPLRTSRSTLQILRENVFTPVNTILFVLGLALIVLGQTSDAIVSVSVAFFNVLVGVVQEIRAKRTLDHIALLTRPKASVMREGHERLIDPRAASSRLRGIHQGAAAVSTFSLFNWSGNRLLDALSPFLPGSPQQNDRSRLT